MFIEASKLKKFSLRALDDELGAVDDLIFEGPNFKIRYIEADTRRWLPGGHVFLSPAAFTELNRENETIGVQLTKEQIKDSPKPSEFTLTREFEKSLNSHYGWDNYWLHPLALPRTHGPTFVGQTPQSPIIPPIREYDEKTLPDERDQTTKTNRQQVPQDNETLLQSFNDLYKYELHAKNGEVGQIVDCIIDYEDHFIRYFIIDVGGFMSKELVVLSTEWITEISHIDKTVTVSNIDQSLISNAPEYKRETLFDREQEQIIYQHYNKQPYWETSIK
ncbi:hypothetical protein BTS2_3986 [Bacillus sp. TS-2]|nr:hypothetical protein BTS2_3986 [Bacillus sp. TS-2]